MDDASGKGPNRAVEQFPICLLVYTNALPPIFLIIKFQCGTVGCQDQTLWGIGWEAHKDPHFIFLKEPDVLKFELDRLFCVVALSFCCILSDSKDIVEGDQRQIANGLQMRCVAFTVTHFHQQFGNVQLDQQHFLCWWIGF